LPYALVGWNELVREKRVYADLCWTNITVTVECTDTARPFVAAALRVFVKRTEKAFYEVKSGSSDRRERWLLVGDEPPTVAKGSASMEVMRALRTMLTGDIAMIARKTQGIRAVRIEARGAEYQTDIEISTSGA
jgi:hypothetical protein